MKLNLSLLVLMTFLSLNAHAQSLKQKHFDYLKEHNISLIDSAALYSNVLQNNGKVKMLVIFTNHCAGTPYIFKDIAANKEKFGDKMEYILCSSASKNQLDDLVEVLEMHGYTGKVYLINPELYKEYRFDDRKKGFAFRNAVCEPCREDVIGVPYRIFFSPENKILFHGYASRNDFNEMLSKYFNDMAVSEK